MRFSLLMIVFAAALSFGQGIEIHSRLFNILSVYAAPVLDLFEPAGNLKNLPFTALAKRKE